MKPTDPRAVHTAADEVSLLTKRELADRIGISTRLVEKWTQHRVIPCLRIGTRLTRYELPRVIDALRAYETQTLNHKK